MDLNKYTFSIKLQVRDYEVDAEGIVNNAEYLHYMEHTRHEFCKMAGCSFRQMHEDGVDPVATRIEVSYINSLGLGDEMISCLNVNRKGPQYIFEQDIYKLDGTSVTRGVVKIAVLENGKLSRGDQLDEVFRPYFKD